MKALKAIFLVFTITLLGAQLRSFGQDATVSKTGMAEPSREAVFPAAAQAGYWDKGRLIAYGTYGFETSPSRAGLILYDRDGAIARESIVWIDGARMVTVSHAAVSPSGNLVVVSGGAMDSEGAIATFIGEIGSDDRLRRIMRTTPFSPRYVCAMNDGTVWAYGFDRDEHLNGVPDSLRLRHYSFEKGQLQAMLNTQALPYSATALGWQFGGMPNEINLRCNSKTVVLYNSTTGDLVEVDLKDNTTTITKVPVPHAFGPDFLITGFALVESGEIFVSFRDRTDKKLAVSGLFRLQRDNAGKGNWVAVPGTVGRYLHDSPIYRLWGADGDELVYSRLNDGKLYWSNPGPQ